MNRDLRYRRRNNYRRDYRRNRDDRDDNYLPSRGKRNNDNENTERVRYTKVKISDISPNVTMDQLNVCSFI